MPKVVKRLPIMLSLLAIGFLIIQIICALRRPLVTADIVDNGVKLWDVAYIQSKGFFMIILSVIGLPSPALALIFLCTIPVLGISYFVIYRFASPLYAKMQKLPDNLNHIFKGNSF